MSYIRKIIVIGAGIGGLTSAAILAKAGLDVTVLEAHVYPGGCAGTFFHKGYRFDAGATLAGGFYAGGPMDLVAQAAGVKRWRIQPAEAAMTVQLADGSHITRWGDERRWQEMERHFGKEGLRFWQWQEKTADALWDFALQIPPWPPQGGNDCRELIAKGLNWLSRDLSNRLQPSLWADAFRPLAKHLPKGSERLRQFVDAQLLISAQTSSDRAYALYAASALDLPRRGVVHLEGGMGAIATTLVDAVRSHGGTVRFRQEVSLLHKPGKRTAHKQTAHEPQFRIVTKRGEHFAADIVIANLPPWNIVRLMQPDAPACLQQLPAQPQGGWGAFMLYAGIDAKAIPADFPLHQQIVMGEPLGEGNSIFLSLSPAWDQGRAPVGERVMTLSTHTQMQPWWEARQAGEDAYAERKAIYQDKILNSLKTHFPWLHEGLRFIMSGTPITFQHFTRREGGWVGGFPQTSLLRMWAPALQPGLWMVGDSIFPGQSTAAVALGGIRVARAVLRGI